MTVWLLIFLAFCFVAPRTVAYGDEDEPLIQKVAEGRSKVEVGPPEEEPSPVQRFADRTLDRTDTTVYQVIEAPWRWFGTGIDATVKAFQAVGRTTYRFLTQPFRKASREVPTERRLDIGTAIL